MFILKLLLAFMLLLLILRTAFYIRVRSIGTVEGTIVIPMISLDSIDLLTGTRTMSITQNESDAMPDRQYKITRKTVDALFAMRREHEAAMQQQYPPRGDQPLPEAYFSPAIIAVNGYKNIYGYLLGTHVQIVQPGFFASPK